LPQTRWQLAGCELINIWPSGQNTEQGGAISLIGVAFSHSDILKDTCKQDLLIANKVHISPIMI
jgi:hypothetical protein